MKKLIIITDLDGTLLDDSTYSFEAADDALRLIRERSIPLIICSSKTRTEIEHYRQLIDNHDPFISENGGGIFIPKKCEDLIHYAQGITIEKLDKYFVLALGIKYGDLRKAIIELRESGFKVKGFGDMNIDEIMALTGLPREEAAMAKERDFDEPFVFDHSGDTFQNLLLAAKMLGFSITKGRLHHLLGNNDKGKAVSLLLKLYKRKFGNIFSAIFGDSLNDLPMLEKADIPVIVQRSNGSYDAALDIHSAIWAHGTGPEGWNRAVKKIVSKIADR